MRTEVMVTGSSRFAGHILGEAMGLVDVLRKAVQQGREAARRSVERARDTWEEMDVLRKAEQQGREAARRSWELTRDIWGDNERRLRRRMRIYPRPNPHA
jgi:flavin-binding protein dodecin